MSNEEVALTLDEAVQEVLGLLTGLDLTYDPDQDRYKAVVRAINRALRSNALEHEWSWYASLVDAGNVVGGTQSIDLPASLRPRIVSDDAVRLVDANGRPWRWGYFLPRDALHKYAWRNGLWCSVTGTTLTFSRAFSSAEDGLRIQLPVMREPEMFRLPMQPTDPELPLVPVPDSTRLQEIDFWYPDVIVLRAAFYYAQTDPVMQPRVQTLEAQYKDLMYQIIERDDRNTDTPYQNPWSLDIQGNLDGMSLPGGHPHADR